MHVSAMNVALPIAAESQETGTIVAISFAMFQLYPRKFPLTSLRLASPDQGRSGGISWIPQK